MISVSLIAPRYRRNLGHRDALQTWRDRDADFVEAPAEGVGSVFPSAHCTAGEGREIPQAGHPGPEPGGMGGGRSAGLAAGTAGLPGLT